MELAGWEKTVAGAAAAARAAAWEASWAVGSVTAGAKATSTVVVAIPNRPLGKPIASLRRMASPQADTAHTACSPS